MNEQEYADAISEEISAVVGGLDQQELARLVEVILAAKRVYVCGAGRSLLMIRAYLKKSKSRY